jgi:hypothetical protein
MAENALAAHVIRSGIWRIQPLSPEGFVVSAVVATLMCHHRQKAVSSAVQKAAKRKSLRE